MKKIRLLNILLKWLFLISFKIKRRDEQIDLPAPGQYAVAVLFVNKESPGIAEYEFEKMATNYNLKVKAKFRVKTDCQ